jgi:hypothetical protein
MSTKDQVAYVYAALYEMTPRPGETLAQMWGRYNQETTSAEVEHRGRPLFGTGVLECPAYRVDDPDFEITVATWRRADDPTRASGESRYVLPRSEDEENIVPVPSDAVPTCVQQVDDSSWSVFDRRGLPIPGMEHYSYEDEAYAEMGRQVARLIAKGVIE